MDDYQLADPRVVTATYDESAPLAGRDMLLRISFKGLPLWVGVRVGQDFEETREVEGRQVHVFGWSYDTLEGHFEEGRMYYELWKWLDTGEVEFHLRSVSRPSRSGFPVIRLGFRLFGRTQQLRFYRQVCRRVRRLTEAQLETERAARLRPDCSGRPSPRCPRLAQALERRPEQAGDVHLGAAEAVGDAGLGEFVDEAELQDLPLAGRPGREDAASIMRSSARS